MSQLSQFLKERLSTKDVLHEDDPMSPPWWEEGSTVEVPRERYFEYLEMLPPRYINGDLFAFGEGAGPLTIFWKERGKFYAHHLSQADTEQFCQLTLVSLLH